jgi:hypothetical protein
MLALKARKKAGLEQSFISRIDHTPAQTFLTRLQR